MDKIKYEKLTLELNSENDGYVIVECDKDVTIVDVPKKVNEIPVVAIGDYAFSECNNLVTITFPNYDINDFADGNLLYEIGEHAFSHCHSLEIIEIPDSVLTISHGAFSNCSSLKKATFSNNAYVAPYAFYECKSLVEVSYITDISEGIFSGCESLPIFPVSNNTKYIEEDAFEGCDSLTEITIPASVKTIGKLAFRGCSNLKLVHFENKDNWYWHYRYKDTIIPIDVSDPIKIAKWLSTMDFDDGVDDLFRK